MCTPWWAWYFSLRPRMMVTLASTDGSGTSTGWKRRASAASFSIKRYSASVVAPTHESSPRASWGLSRLEASIAPSAAPAPMTVWSSSMKRITSPPASVTSLSTALKRSSNSPRYLAPATRAPTSSATTRASRIDSGTSLSTIRCASPSTTAVFPTPGSPINTGLFFRRRESTCSVRRISSSRPTTGSSFPALANSLRSVPYFLRASPFGAASGFTHVEPCCELPAPPPAPEPPPVRPAVPAPLAPVAIWRDDNARGRGALRQRAEPCRLTAAPRTGARIRAACRMRAGC
mmetsp:Transcript_56575/g.126380  ORF Transcript_56575/g.126380 Transcript_56575/m.126380 type:complete len:290 (-) Transcript_56575:2-871(-)